MDLRKLAKGRECQGSRKIRCVCAQCGREYRKRADRVLIPDYCGLACRKAVVAAATKARERPCAVCASPFIPRAHQLKIGQGRFCSNQCALLGSEDKIHTPESRKKAVATYRANGYDKVQAEKRGPLHPMWTGGPVVARRRQVESGKARARSKAYRDANPERVREWSQKRKDRKTGRLPKGTVAALFSKQRGQCVYCKTALNGRYHVDHIMPLLLGGAHEPTNVQLLCPTCNVRKWAMHPVDFAQTRGMLL